MVICRRGIRFSRSIRFEPLMPFRKQTSVALKPNSGALAAQPGTGVEESPRRPRVRILFAHSNKAQVERAIGELKRIGYCVEAQIVPDAAHIHEQPVLHSFDAVVCEYALDAEHRVSVLTFLAQYSRYVPLILLGQISKEDAAALILHGAAECVDPDAIGHLPVAIRRALNEKSLRRERDRAEKELRRLQAQYRALSGNLNYGICRCSPTGAFLDVNQTLVTMLGYCSKEELMTVNVARSVFADPEKLGKLLGEASLMPRRGDSEPGSEDNDATENSTEPVEVDWPRKSGASLKVRLSAQRVPGDHGQPDSYEVIVEDITKQRELEDHLRRLAASDPLTGLANYRHLIDALDMEIRRSNRTGREFALLLFDMDGLKQLNDSFGHLVGSQALCRIADALTLFCRDIDTAARFGGDEFALLLPETGLEAAHSVARRISHSIADDSNGPPISVSVGISTFPHDGEMVEALVSAADAAMYAMKRQRKQPAASQHSA
jgi:diguanylate cyclase (GGDEF)-like protein/PAS domain S-box-containing protein